MLKLRKAYCEYRSKGILVIVIMLLVWNVNCFRARAWKWINSIMYQYMSLNPLSVKNYFVVCLQDIFSYDIIAYWKSSDKN